MVMVSTARSAKRAVPVPAGPAPGRRAAAAAAPLLRSRSFARGGLRLGLVLERESIVVDGHLVLGVEEPGPVVGLARMEDVLAAGASVARILRRLSARRQAILGGAAWT